MSTLSVNAARILEHLYEEKDPVMRMVGGICIALLLDTPNWVAASKELLEQQLIAQHGATFSVTPNGMRWMKRTRQPAGADAVSVEAIAATAPLAYLCR